MCSRYEAPTSERLLGGFGTSPDQPFKTALWPGYMGPFLRARGEDGAGEGENPVAALVGMFGLLPFWAKDTKLARSTYNCRSETAASEPTFRSAWAKAQHCIIPCTAFYRAGLAFWQVNTHAHYPGRWWSDRHRGSVGALG